MIHSTLWNMERFPVRSAHHLVTAERADPAPAFEAGLSFLGSTLTLRVALGACVEGYPLDRREPQP
ncbi:MAG: hypothetical protein ABIK09_19635, partial [Pseudomonadota bacterium]